MKHKIKTVGFYTSIIFVFGLIIGLAGVLDNRWYSYVIILLAVSCLIYIRKQLQIRGIKYAGVWIITILIAFLSLNYGRPDLSISFRGNLMNEGVKAMTFTMHDITGEGIDIESTPYKFGSWDAPDGYKNELIELSESKAYLLTKEESKHQKIVYQIHGGAYISGFKNSYNETALNYSIVYDDADVFSLDYRTAPENLYPAALDDAIDGYNWLLKQGYKPENIIVAGDSAGGGLSLAMTLKLRDTGQPLPKMLVLSSPWTDLAAEGESYKTKIQADPMFGSSEVVKAPRYPVPVTYAGNHDLHDPYISPAYGDYSGMPPMIIQTGIDELLLSDSETVAENATKAGVNVEFIAYKGMFHTFYIVAPSIPESQKAWKEIERFIHEK